MKSLRNTTGLMLSFSFHVLILLILTQMWTQQTEEQQLQVSLSFSEDVVEENEVVPFSALLPAPEFEDIDDNNEDDGSPKEGEADDLILANAEMAILELELAGQGSGASVTDGDSFGPQGDGDGGRGAFRDRILYLIGMRYEARSASYYYYQQQCKKLGQVASLPDFLQRRNELLKANLTDQDFAVKYFGKLVDKTAQSYGLICDIPVYMQYCEDNWLWLNERSWRSLNRGFNRFHISEHGARWNIFTAPACRVGDSKVMPRIPIKLHLNKSLPGFLPTRICLLTNGESCNYSRRQKDNDWISELQYQAESLDISIDVVFLSSPRWGVQKDWHIYAKKRLKELTTATGGKLTLIGYKR